MIAEPCPAVFREHADGEAPRYSPPCGRRLRYTGAIDVERGAEHRCTDGHVTWWIAGAR